MAKTIGRIKVSFKKSYAHSGEEIQFFCIKVKFKLSFRQWQAFCSISDAGHAKTCLCRPLDGVGRGEAGSSAEKRETRTKIFLRIV